MTRYFAVVPARSIVQETFCVTVFAMASDDTTAAAHNTGVTVFRLNPFNDNYID